MGLRRLRVLAVAVALGPGAAGAQQPPDGREARWSTRSTAVDVAVADDGAGVVVGVRYRLGSADGGTLPVDRPIPFELLGFAGALVERFTVSDGRTVELWPTRGSHRAAALQPPFEVRDSILELDVSYVVDGAIRHDGGPLTARIPLLVGPPGTTADVAGAFEAALTLPLEWVVSEGFPSGLRQDAGGAWRVSLQTPPAMIGFRGRSDGVARPGVPFLVDLVTLVILLAFSFVGWRHLSSVARRARA